MPSTTMCNFDMMASILNDLLDEITTVKGKFKLISMFFFYGVLSKYHMHNSNINLVFKISTLL